MQRNKFSLALSALCVIGASAALTSCGEKTETEVAAPEGIPGLEISNARVVLNAVSGNPAAAYFDLKYTADRGLTIRAIDVKGGEHSMMHQYGEWNRQMQMMEMDLLPLTQGKEYHFKPGDMHVMVMKPSPDLKPGTKTEITFIVSGGDKTTVSADVKAAGSEG